MGFIYKITNQVNGKMYIGKTEHYDPIKRWKSHIEDSKKIKAKNRPLYNAMNKYGVENFCFEPICEEQDSDKLCELEKYYINKYRTYVGFDDSNGYNVTLGGDGRCYIKLDDQEVIEVHIQNNYIAGRTAQYFNVDHHLIQKILFRNNIKWLTAAQVTEFDFLQIYGGLVQISKDADKIINVFNSTSGAVNYNEKFKYTTLNLAYTGHNKNHYVYGYIWYRLSELPDQYEPLLQEYLNSHKEELGLRYYDIIDFITSLDSDNLEIDDTELDLE